MIAPRDRMPAVTIHEFSPVRASDGQLYYARACARKRDDGLWEGWLEFDSPRGATYRTDRETTQPNRTDIVYWATGLSLVYLEGALGRARGFTAVAAHR